MWKDGIQAPEIRYRIFGSSGRETVNLLVCRDVLGAHRVSVSIEKTIDFVRAEPPPIISFSIEQSLLGSGACDLLGEFFGGGLKDRCCLIAHDAGTLIMRIDGNSESTLLGPGKKAFKLIAQQSGLLEFSIEFPVDEGCVNNWNFE